MLFCNITAGWAESSLSVETSTGHADVVNSSVQTSVYNSPFDYLSTPLQLINITSSWAEFLNPLVYDHNNSLINFLMRQIVGPVAEVPLAQDILAMLTVNGLARTSRDSVIQGDVKTVKSNGQTGLDGNYWLSGQGDVFETVDPADARDWVTFRVDSSLEGYAYNILTKPPRVASAILTISCVLVVGRTIYSEASGKSFFNPRHPKTFSI